MKNKALYCLIIIIISFGCKKYVGSSSDAAMYSQYTFP